jgi:hypothetical protein
MEPCGGDGAGSRRVDCPLPSESPDGSEVFAAYDAAGQTMACKMMDRSALDGLQAFYREAQPWHRTEIAQILEFCRAARLPLAMARGSLGRGQRDTAEVACT